MVKWFVDESAVLVLLSNDFLYYLPPIFGIPQNLERAMFGEPLPQVPSIATVSQVEPYTGRYRLEGGPAFDLTSAGSGIGLKLVEEEDTRKWDSGTLPLPRTHLRLFVPSSPEGGFVFYDPLQQITSHLYFERDDDGRTSLWVESEGVRVRLGQELSGDGH